MSRQPGAQAQARAIAAGGGPQWGYHPHPFQPKRQRAAFSTGLTLGRSANALRGAEWSRVGRTAH
jgi:hypothetical protein